ncbi:hypothetical protein [Niabella hibiscisoli]|uniref:hypothetical protein n=1 Tax=Niabella hibiscisoli TaxID=1825928 RepID=UPI001F0F8A30|nr:hypothetical protein [Niabella hibiscisoli]MCH5717012.1 hypothetical protein [Niabella hibiscisoli]
MKLIQLAYRRVIDIESKAHWERYVFEDSYKELRMQFQLFNTDKKHITFSQLVAQVPEAEKLHFLVSAAIAGHISLLGKIPYVQNTLGITVLPFNLYRFEIIDSNINNKNAHRVAVIFYSAPVVLHEIIGEHLLVSLDPDNNNNERKMVQTELIKLQPFLSIYSIQYQHHATSIISNNILS